MADFLKEIASLAQLEQAWNHVKRKRKVTPGIDDIGVRDFENSWKENIGIISEQLKNGTYVFNKVVQQQIPKKRDRNKKRSIRIYCVRDKVAQTSIRITFERLRGSSTLFPEIANSISIGYLDKQYYKGDAVGVKLAIERIRNLYNLGYKYFIKADIKDFFDNVDKGRLKKILVSRLNADPLLNSLVVRLLDPVVVKIDRYTDIETLLPRTASGVAQGSVISPLLSNIYLIDFDKALENFGIKAVRYADDMIVAAKGKGQAERLKYKIVKLLYQHSGLEFHKIGSPKGPKTYNINNGLDFLGVFIQKTQKGKRWCTRPSSEKITDLKNTINSCLSPRKNESLYSRIDYLNRSIQSWFSTYNYCKCTAIEMKKIYNKLKEIYTSQVNHLLLINKITKKLLSKEQMEFLGILPPKISRRKRK